MADRVARLRVRGGRYGARVQDDDFRAVLIRGARKTARKKLALDRDCIRVRRAATEIFDEERSQGLSGGEPERRTLIITCIRQGCRRSMSRPVKTRVGRNEKAQPAKSQIQSMRGATNYDEPC